MKIRLVSPLCMSDFVTPELSLRAGHPDMAPQLGILCLAASLIEAGYRPDIVNLDQVFMDYLSRQIGQNQTAISAESNWSSEPSKLSKHEQPTRDGRLFEALLHEVANAEFDVVGFGTISSTFPLTIRLARAVKKAFPNTTVILGGPQASAVDIATVSVFGEIDYVLRGEADYSLPQLVAILGGENTKSALPDIPGICFRHDGRVVRNPHAPRVEDLNSLPFPAFHLDGHINERSSVHLEIGRGCPFACTFCSTNDFFRRNFRLKSDEVMIKQMGRIQDLWGISNFSLVHDMYTIDRKRVLSFCGKVKESKLGVVWSCSARTDCVDEELLSVMADSGCRGIFFGIETGSPRLQKLIKKNLDLSESRRHIAVASRCGIGTAVALITAFPDETRADLRDTAEFFVDSLRYDGAEPQMSLLAPLAETPLTTQHWEDLVFDQIYSDMSHQGWRLDPEDFCLIRDHREMFPNFYSIPTHHVPRKYFSEVRDFLLALQTWFRWLPIALLLDSVDFLQMHDVWRDWLTAETDGRESSTETAAPYYCTIDFVRDFGRFIRSQYIPRYARFPRTISTVTCVEIDGPLTPPLAVNHPPIDMKLVFRSPSTCYPYIPHPGSVLRLESDYKLVVESLRQRAAPEDLPMKQSTVAITRPAPSILNVQQLEAVGARLIDLCDGSKTIEGIMAALGGSTASQRISNLKETVFIGLSLFRSWNLLSFASAPVYGAGVSRETAMQNFGACRA